ncbi:hypothetical protein [Candidatus Nitrososphaera sp. FF02]|uniref:hypothetical protein n=1 Tax=Candidatus Nitrososphaera sp. FF02 TaxID=3398226 RepID=UPI0039EA1216
MIKILVICLVIGLLSASSLVAGFPRKDSVGPYKNTSPNYPSEYDVRALEFIKNRVEKNDKPFIVGDAYSNFAAVRTLGYQTIVIDDEAYPLLSNFKREERWNANSLWNLALRNPSQFIFDGLSETSRYSNTTYLIISYRESNFMQYVDSYLELAGDPVFTIANAVYVFEFNKDRYSGLKIDNDPTTFWTLAQIGNGTLSFSISNIDNVLRNSSMLQIKIEDGEYQRATLSHKFGALQSWSEYEFISIVFDGMASGQSFNIIIRSQSANDYYYFTIKDDSEVPKGLLIPLERFTVGEGAPSWSTVSEIMIQLIGNHPEGEIYFESIELVP